MRAFSLLAFLAVVYADCDTSSCYVCQQNASCGWYTAGPLSDCRLISSVPNTLNVTLTQNGSCPICQAGSCSECQANPSGTCQWWQSSIPGLGGKCAPNTTDSMTGYTMVPSCPLCNNYDNDCAGCQAQTNSSCSYYSLLGGASKKCRESSPGFAYSLVPPGFCTGNPCDNLQSCSECQNYQDPATNATICAWFDSKEPVLYGPKCDSNKTGVVDTTLYTTASTCPPCTAATCVSCKKDSTCKWVAVPFGVGTAFGQCLQTTTATPGGKSEISVCPATCQVHSCSQCISSTDCRWYSNNVVSLVLDKCDLASDAWQYGAYRSTVAQGGTCPACRANRCYECGSESGCGWYVNKVAGVTVPGSAVCKSTASAGSMTNIPVNDPDCEGNPNGASAMAPGLLALAVAVFVYHN